MPDYQQVASGSFTSTGTAKDIPLRSDFDYFETENHTQMATTQATGRGVFFRWYNGYSADSAFMISKANSANTVTYEVVTVGGFTRVDTSVQAPQAAKTITTPFITAATPAVVTVTTHGYSNGDRIRIYGTTSMLQIAGMEFTIGSVAANDFELSYLAAAGFASAATAGFARRIPNNPIYVPAKNYITAITAANPMVVTLSITHNLEVDDVVRLHVPTEFGMIQADNLQGKVTAINTTTNTVTLDINSTAFTPFVFPTSAVAAGGVTQAHLVPFGTVANGVEQALKNEAKILMHLAAGVDSPAGSEGDKIYWRAFKSGFVNNE